MALRCLGAKQFLPNRLFSSLENRPESFGGVLARSRCVPLLAEDYPTDGVSILSRSVLLMRNANTRLG